VLLNKGDDAVLAPPEAWFGREIARLLAEGHRAETRRFTPKPAPDNYAKHTTAAEVSDLRTALRRLGVSRGEIERTVKAHANERIKLTDFGTNSPQVAAGLPPEFAGYFRGSIAWNKGDHATASYEWRELLARPPAERQFKSTWAAYMLGQLSLKDEPEQAIKYFQQVRSLVELGFADSTGLAAASIGWEARAHFIQQRFIKAIELYCQAGDTLSLKWVATAALGQRALYSRLATNPLVRRVITARIISREQWPDRQDDSGVAWLEAVDQEKDFDSEEAEMLALAAYQNDEFETALRWIKRAPSTFVTQWLQARMHARAGRLNEAIAILSSLEANSPAESGESDEAKHQTLADNIFIRAGYGAQVQPAAHIAGELGVLHLTLSDYNRALDCFLRGGFWMDAAYIAERVLTVDELKSYVDGQWRELRADSEDAAPSGTREGIRYLLARRLGRLCLPARAYFPEERREKYDELITALKQGETETLPADERADGWWEGAKILREEGLELIGTELEPDWHIHGGDSQEGVTVSGRETNKGARVLVASADELNRARRHRADPEARFHYRYQAAFIALQAASLLPDNSDQKARILCTAGSWLKGRDAITADIFYKHLVRRCRKTALGRAADVTRWFPLQDVNGDLEPPPEVLVEAASDPASETSSDNNVFLVE
jgi:tetratricopeptide (TPR) repeat protein